MKCPTLCLSVLLPLIGWVMPAHAATDWQDYAKQQADAPNRAVATLLALGRRATAQRQWQALLEEAKKRPGSEIEYATDPNTGELVPVRVTIRNP